MGIWERMVDNFMNLSGVGKTAVVLISLLSIRTILRDIIGDED